MSHELYRKHRPKTLDRVIGNRDTVTALSKMLELGKVPHSLLFSGPSGCGKTTLARIMAHELGCSPADLCEMNAASFRGIDTIRDIQRVLHLSPVGGKCRAWIVDEAHQLSKDAQNAALKMLEDTPDHVYFLFCTTDPDKLILTVRNRLSPLPVSRLDHDDAERLIKRVAKKEGIDLSSDGLRAVVEQCGGSARAALVILDKIRHVPRDKQAEAATVPSEEERATIDLCRALIKRAQWAEVAKILRALKAEPEEVRYGVLGYARQVLLGNPKSRAYAVICAFAEPFFHSREAGLAAACYEALFGDGR